MNAVLVEEDTYNRCADSGPQLTSVWCDHHSMFLAVFIAGLCAVSKRLVYSHKHTCPTSLYSMLDAMCAKLYTSPLYTTCRGTL